MLRNIFAGAALAALTVLPAGAAEFLLAGVQVDGYASECTVGAPFVSCAVDQVVSSFTPGTGQFHACTDGSLGTGSYSACASFIGYLDEPTISAFAGAGSTPAGEEGFYLWTDASAGGRVIQGYTYHGTAPATFEVRTDLLAAIDGGPLNQVFANVSIFDAATYDPNEEILPIITFASISENGIADDQSSNVDQSVYLTFELQPGQGVYMIVDLIATAVSRRLGNQSVEVDATHTLNVTFTNGPFDLLTPAITGPPTTVPEPGTALLLGAGLLGLAWARRRR